LFPGAYYDKIIKWMPDASLPLTADRKTYGRTVATMLLFYGNKKRNLNISFAYFTKE
jgi:hypothetical protein